MSKLTKQQYKAHAEACRLLEKDVLSWDDRWFVLENWKESATHINSQAGAFFTPLGLASDFSIEVGGRRIIDLCAGIGMLAFQVFDRGRCDASKFDLVCVERNPDYAAVGRKVLPEATWIVADVFDLPPDLGHFDYAISNPPFGSTPREKAALRYKGRAFEYHVIDIASDLADDGAFILPQMSAPFRYSGRDHYEWRPEREYEKFKQQTGIELSMNCGIDCSVYEGDWNGVAPKVEIALADFAAARAARKPAQTDLFGAAA